LIRPDVVPTVSETIEQVLIQGDLAPLTPEQRVAYYKAVCKSLGLNALTSPFGYILFKETENAPAKLALYAKKDAAEQLRKIHGVSVIPKTTTQEVTEDFATTRLSLMDKTGRTDTATGIVYLWKKYNNQPYRLTGQRLGDAIMKSETKAKRRGTLSICGLGILDEMDLESVRVVGGVTPDGRIYQFAPPVDPEDVPPSRQLDENAAHGHPEGSERAKQAEEALRRVEQEDRRLAEQAKNTQASEPQPKKKGSQTKPEPPDVPNAEVPKAKPVPPMEFQGLVEIDCTVEWPIVRGDIQNITERLSMAYGTAFEWGQDSWWHIDPKYVSELVDLLSSTGFKVDVKIKTPPKSSAGQKSAMTSPPSEAAGSGAGSGRDQSAAPTVISGTVERVVPDVKYAVITLATKDGKKPSWKCFDKDISEILRKNLGKLAEVILQTRISKDVTYTNLIGLKNVAGQEYEDLKVPVVQQKNREAGGRTLFP